MAAPEVAFTLRDENRDLLKLPACTGEEAQKDRLAAVLGREFRDNAVPIDAQREGLHLTGLIGLPTYHRATTTSQYLFVNGRAVRDRLLLGALKGGYEDMIPRGRYPAVALFLDVDPEAVDVKRPSGQSRGAVSRQRCGAWLVGGRGASGFGRIRVPGSLHRFDSDPGRVPAWRRRRQHRRQSRADFAHLFAQPYRNDCAVTSRCRASRRLPKRHTLCLAVH